MSESRLRHSIHLVWCADCGRAHEPPECEELETPAAPPVVYEPEDFG